MTVSFLIKDASFPASVPLFDLPDADKCRVFAVIGGSLARSMANYGSAGKGVVIGNPRIERNGLYLDKNNYLRFPTGTLSTSSITQFVAFRSPATPSLAGLTNLWGSALLVNDSNRRRISLTTSSSLTQVYTSTPTGSDAETNRGLNSNTAYVLSFSRNGNGIASGALRLHSADGTILRSGEIPAIAPALSYSADTVLDVGPSTADNAASILIGSVGLWSGLLDDATTVKIAAVAARASGLF